jgi:hypothetical protein
MGPAAPQHLIKKLENCKKPPGASGHLSCGKLSLIGQMSLTLDLTIVNWTTRKGCFTKGAVGKGFDIVLSYGINYQRRRSTKIVWEVEFIRTHSLLAGTLFDSDNRLRRIVEHTHERNELKMATSVEELKMLNDQQIRQSILQNINRWEHACAPDLAGLIGHGVTADEIIPVLESLVSEGLLEHMKKESKDPRDYKGPYQRRYRLTA